MRHHTNELSFERPDGLLDRTHHVFAVAEQGPSPFTVVISRSPIEDETLDEMVARILTDLAHTLTGFVLDAQDRAEVGGAPAAMLRFRWQQGGQQLFQHQAALIHHGAGTRALIQIAATATADARPHHVTAFKAMLATVRLRDADAEHHAD